MYMPGRSRTGWRPLRMEMSLAAYATRSTLSSGLPAPRTSPRSVTGSEPSSACCSTPFRHAKDLVKGGVSGVLSLPERGSSAGPPEGLHDDLQRGHETGSGEALRPLDHLRFEVSQLGRPGCPVDRDRAHAVAQAPDGRVLRDGRPDELWPGRHERRHVVVLGQSELRADRRDRVAEPHRLVARPAAGHKTMLPSTM